MPSAFTWSNTERTCSSQTSISMMYRPSIFGSSRTGGFTDASLSVSYAVCSISWSSTKFVGWPFVSFLLSGAEILVKQCTNCLKTFHKPRKEHTSVAVLRGRNFSTAWQALLCTVSFPGIMVCPRYWNLVANYMHLSIRRVAPAFWSKDRTAVTCPKYSSNGVEKTMTSSK